jgi:elongation factor Ts
MLMDIMGHVKKRKKMSKKLKQGKILVKKENNIFAAAAVKCETDFLARSKCMDSALSEMCDKMIADEGWTDEEMNAIAAQLSQDAKEETLFSDGYDVYESIALITNHYLHHDNRKLGIVRLNTDGPLDKISELAYNLAMHLVAFNPDYENALLVKWGEIDLSLPEDILKSKPENIIESIREGKKKKYAKEHVFMDQPYVKDMTKSVGQMLEEFNKEHESHVIIMSYYRLEV